MSRSWVTQPQSLPRMTLLLKEKILMLSYTQNKTIFPIKYLKEPIGPIFSLKYWKTKSSKKSSSLLAIPLDIYILTSRLLLAFLFVDGLLCPKIMHLKLQVFGSKEASSLDICTPCFDVQLKPVHCFRQAPVSETNKHHKEFLSMKQKEI